MTTEQNNISSFTCSQTAGPEQAWIPTIKLAIYRRILYAYPVLCVALCQYGATEKDNSDLIRATRYFIPDKLEYVPATQEVQVDDTIAPEKKHLDALKRNVT